jgi:ferric-dicitrate binding protein FerR (iron transport regulator)
MVELVRADIRKQLASAQPMGGVRLRITERAQPGAGMQPTVSSTRPMPLRRKPASRLLAWAAVLLAIAGMAAFFLFNRKETVDVPVIASVQGEVRLVGAGGERALTPGDSWRHDEKLKTVGTGSAAAVNFHDGSQLDFGGNTVAVNESSEAGLRVLLDHGTMQATLKRQPALHPFVFATPAAEAIVVGTTLRLVSGGHHTRLEVTEGAVRFRRRHDGAEVVVKAGHSAVVAPNAPLIATPFHTDPHHAQ